MVSDWLHGATAWIAQHPLAAGALVFLIAFGDALAVVGIVVPALPMLFAVGTLIGLGHLNGPYTLAAAALGALCGDGLSYWIGHRFGPGLRGRWPFSRYPSLLDRGERLFRRQGSSAILVARFVGPVRPFVPAIAGMLGMPLKRYLPMSAFAGVLWAASFLAPGWAFGASYDAVAAVADRLLLLALVLVAVLATVWAVVVYASRWFVGHADALLVRTLRFARQHPRLAGWIEGLVDPQRPESASLLLLAVVLFVIAWAWGGLSALLVASGGPLLLDLEVHALMHRLRYPLAEAPLGWLLALGDPRVLLPPALLGMAWLWWRKRRLAAVHWLVAIGFGMALSMGLGALVATPRPPLAPAGFGFPPLPVVLSTITLGFFAVLIAREYPGRRRVWPYLLGGALSSLVAVAGLYFGLWWLSDALLALLLGIAWLLLLGIAYRRHVTRSFLIKPLAWLFYAALAVSALWQGPRLAAALRASLPVPMPPAAIAGDAAHWWQGAWALLPSARRERDPGHRWPLDVQLAGPAAPLVDALARTGWHTQPEAGWVQALGLLDPARDGAQQAILPATFDGHAEALLLWRAAPADGADRRWVLRLWRAPAPLADGTPLWVGSTQTLGYARPLGWFGLWRPVDAAGDAQRAVAEALGALPHDARARGDGTRVLLVCTLARVTESGAGCAPGAPADLPRPAAPSAPAPPSATVPPGAN
jgi:membrane protein DedA with SNARE-associated domain